MHRSVSRVLQGCLFPLVFHSMLIFFRPHLLLFCCIAAAGLGAWMLRGSMVSELEDPVATTRTFSLQSRLESEESADHQLQRPRMSKALGREDAEGPSVAGIFSEFVVQAHAPTTAIEPNGWRRTVNGWEHTSTWKPKPHLAELIAQQREQEDYWLGHFLQSVRALPPLAFASLQIAAISGIIWVSQFAHRSRVVESNRSAIAS